MERRRPVLAIGLMAVLASCVGSTANIGPPTDVTTVLSASPLANTSPVTSHSPSIAPSATPSPAPVASPPAELKKLATLERDGVRLTLELDASPILLDSETWATMTVENLGTNTVFFMTDGCVIPVQLLVRPGGDWTGGADQLGVAGEFKRLALFGDSSGHGRLIMGFRPEQRLGRESGCADTAIPSELKPKRSLTQRSLWSPWTDIPVPSVPMTLEASFPFSGRGRLDQNSEPIVVELASWIIGNEPWPWMTPAQAVDAALADPTFFTWLLDAPSRTWINAYMDLDPEANIWKVGLFRDAPGKSWVTFVQMDAATGRVIPSDEGHPVLPGNRDAYPPAY